MTSISANLQAVKSRIVAASVAAGRDPACVTLLAVSKTWPADAVRQAAGCGQIAFGENYVQEAVAKAEVLSDLGLEWHFIGPLQSNKTRLIAETFAWVHSIDRLKLAERLSQQRPPGMPPLQVCVQVNVSNEASKRGCSIDEAPVLCRAVAALPNLKLRGLMAIPEPSQECGAAPHPSLCSGPPDSVLRPAGWSAVVARHFGLLRELRDQLNQEGLGLDTLSMGMSDDLEDAIMAGATIVRVGTAIFGGRAKT